jgi:hypothetical protein
MDLNTLALYTSLRAGALPADAPMTCVYYRSILPFGTICGWTDGGDTPICPRCGIDFIVPGTKGAEALAEAHEAAFGLPPGVERMSPEQAAFFLASFGDPVIDDGGEG